MCLVHDEDTLQVYSVSRKIDFLLIFGKTLDIDNCYLRMTAISFLCMVVAELCH